MLISGDNKMTNREIYLQLNDPYYNRLASIYTIQYRESRKKLHRTYINWIFKIYIIKIVINI